MIAVAMHAASRIAGVDEAGRGPLAGPVVVAAVILDPSRPIAGLADSKQLSARRRESLEPRIFECALACAVIEVDAAMIDSINILQATLRGMRLALEALQIAPDLALIDGNRLPQDLRCPARAMVGGDASVEAISAASILAKVHRDRCMHAFDAIHPGYGFATHMGYPTPSHLAALRVLGPCTIHRRSFAPVRASLRFAAIP
ncbi:MAG TPA: ribonuclease HII [Xanthomonadaceae bacterium]|nr:ribonuclease HII [Xanthomonadaceae bacterium]